MSDRDLRLSDILLGLHVSLLTDFMKRLTQDI